MQVRIEMGVNSLLNPNVPDKRINEAQKWLDNEVIKDCNPYVPFRDGDLATSVIRHTVLGSGQIVYQTPYAVRVYHSNGWNFNKKPHELATDHWAEPAKANNLDKYNNGVSKILGGK